MAQWTFQSQNVVFLCRLRDIGKNAIMPVLCTLYRHCYETSVNTPSFFHPYGAMNLIAALAIRILIANSCTRWRWILKELSRTGDGQVFLKTSAPHYLKTNYRMILLSARSISMDSNFKKAMQRFLAYQRFTVYSFTFIKYIRRDPPLHERPPHSLS
jgi:hypothetical protein